MKKYDNIQILRVLSCVGVFITHLAPRMGAAGFLASAANFGASGVYLFFLISGFLACRSRELMPGNGWRGVLAYYCRRFFRILPLYYAVILYNMALHCLILKDVPADPAGLYWLRYFLLTNAVIPGPDNFWSNLSATWTISLFCFFYLCAPLFVRLIAGRREAEAFDKDGRAGMRTDKKMGMAGVCRTAEGFAGPGVLRAAALYLLTLLLRYVWVAAGLSSYMMAFYYLHYFVLGMLLWELAAAYRPGAAAMRFVLFAVVLGAVIQISGAGNDYFTVISWFYATALLATGGFSWKPKEDGEPGCIARIVGVLDAHSYSIYLVHAAVIDGIALLQAHVRLPGVAVFVMAVGLTAVGSCLANILIEKPAEKSGRRLVAQLKICYDKQQT